MSHINPSIKRHLNKDRLATKPLSYYVDGIVKRQDYYVLSESITLLESDHTGHEQLGLDILDACYPHRVPSVRHGITGSPGVGKSTFIDSVAGTYAAKGDKVGILTVDPSSTDGKGSILGDKTRMEELAKHKSIFIRPSPSNRHLGGLNQYTFEAMILCEAAGINRIFIETVGVGQSEVAVSHSTDATILLVLPGSGDSLQGIKKGVIEKADMIVIHKSDGDAKNLAKSSAKEFGEAMHLRRPGFNIPITSYSSITEEGKEELIRIMDEMMETKQQQLANNRRLQEGRWLSNAVKENLENRLALQLNQLKLQDIVSQKLKKPSPFAALSFITHHLDFNIQIKE